MANEIPPSPPVMWTLFLAGFHGVALALATIRLVHYKQRGYLKREDAFFAMAVLSDAAMLVVFVFLGSAKTNNVYLRFYWITLNLYFFTIWTLKAAFLMLIALAHPTFLENYMRTIRLLGCTLVLTGISYCIASDLLCKQSFDGPNIDAFCPVPLGIGILNTICSVFTDITLSAGIMYLSRRETVYSSIQAHLLISLSMTATTFSIIATIVCWTEILTRNLSNTSFLIHLMNLMTAMALFGANIFLVPTMTNDVGRRYRPRRNEIHPLRSLPRYEETQSDLPIRPPDALIPGREDDAGPTRLRRT